MSSAPNPDMMSTDDLVEFLIEANAAYRAGNPIISDGVYDHVYRAELVRRDPSHSFLNSVEPEQVKFGRRVTHETPMLSTEKAYEEGDIHAFIRNVTKAAEEVGQDAVDGLMFEVTPKLDGQAGFHYGDRMVTRGDGRHGEDISHITEMLVLFSQNRICQPNIGGNPLGAGEIVIDADYFEREIREQFDMRHPRNFVVGLTGADELKPHHIKALSAGAVYFAPFAYLDRIELTPDELMAQFADLPAKAKTATPFATDGVVVRVVDERVREVMGAGSTHHHWMMAIKEEGESAEVEVVGVTAQVGRTGRITPVLELKPTMISGALVSRVTAHNMAYVEDNLINVGSTIKLVRAGEVIPYIAHVLKQSEHPATVSACPSCGAALETCGENTHCTNGPDKCRAQAEGQVSHFFETMQNVDLFGPSAITKLHDAGFKTITDVVSLTKDQAVSAGFSDKEAQNLIGQLDRMRTEPVEDWRFLASFGIEYLGRGSSRKLLQEHSLASLGQIDAKAIAKINGFGDVTAPSIARDLKAAWPMIEAVRSSGMNLVLTKSASDLVHTAGAGQKIVFTGTLSIPRKEAEKLAAEAGYVPAGSVSAESLLVTGDKVGTVKIEAARKKGAEVITESEFMNRLNGATERMTSDEHHPQKGGMDAQNSMGSTL